MKRVLFSLVAAAALGTTAASAQTTPASATSAASAAGAPTVVNRSGSPVDVERIIRTFTQREAEFRKALNQYSFKRDAVIQAVAPLGGQILGEYHRTSRFVFDDSGARYEKILHFPVPTLQLTMADIEALSSVQTFALDAAKAHEYSFTYVGKEKIDELDTYVFEVTPKILSDQPRMRALKRSKDPERFFQGRVWVDDKDFQIVKARGKGVPEFDERFPIFESYREQIDGKYWFPTYTYADDELTFKDGSSARIRMRVKFTDFERLRGRATVIEEGAPGDTEDKDKDKKPATPPAKKP
jgi:hypothetical protein